MHENDVGSVLQERLASLRFPTADDAQRELQRCVWAYVDDRKAAGWPAERVIIAVKQLARDVGIKPSTIIVKRDARPTTRDEFLVDMIGWCIHRYYRQDERTRDVVDAEGV